MKFVPAFLQIRRVRGAASRAPVRIPEYTREAKALLSRRGSPPLPAAGFVEAARSRNLELIRRCYIIHDTTGRPAGRPGMQAGRPGAGPRRLTGFLHNACVDLFSEVSGRQPSGRLFFARTSCRRHTRDSARVRVPLVLLFFYPPSFTRRIVSSSNRYAYCAERDA